jgi:hypothetical protein
MKTESTLLQILALGACFVARLARLCEIVRGKVAQGMAGYARQRRSSGHGIAAGKSGNGRAASMKNASRLIQTLALGICFFVNFSPTPEFSMPGIRRALQIMTISKEQPLNFEQPDAVADVD